MIYISDSETGELSQIDSTIEELRQTVQEYWIDNEYPWDVVNNQEDWDNYIYGAGWTIYDQIEQSSVKDFLSIDPDEID